MSGLTFEDEIMRKAIILFLLLASSAAMAGGKHDYKIIPYVPEPPVINDYTTTNNYYQTECDYCDGYAAASVAGDNIHFDHDQGLQMGIGAGGVGGSSAGVLSIGGTYKGALISGSGFATSENKTGLGVGVSWGLQ